MLYLVEGRIKRGAERIVTIQSCGDGYYVTESLKFIDNSERALEDCIELSFKGLRDSLLMLRTKILMWLNSWMFPVIIKVKNAHSIF